MQIPLGGYREGAAALMHFSERCVSCQARCNILCNAAQAQWHDVVRVRLRPAFRRSAKPCHVPFRTRTPVHPLGIPSVGDCQPLHGTLLLFDRQCFHNGKMIVGCSNENRRTNDRWKSVCRCMCMVTICFWYFHENTVWLPRMMDKERRLILNGMNFGFRVSKTRVETPLCWFEAMRDRIATNPNMRFSTRRLLEKSLHS